MRTLLWCKRCSTLKHLPCLHFSSFFSPCLAAFGFGWSLSIARSWRNINSTDRWSVYHVDDSIFIRKMKWNLLKNVQIKLTWCAAAPYRQQRGLFATVAAEDERRRTLWLGLGSASSNTIRGLGLCTRRTLSGLVLKSKQNTRTLRWSLSHLRGLWQVLLLLDKPRPQGRGKAFWKRVAILACHDQVKGCAELRERERSVSVHVTQLPGDRNGRTRLHYCTSWQPLIW